MRRLRRFPSDAAVRPAPVPLSWVIGPDMRRPGIEDPARDRIWLDVSREVGAATVGTPWDLRRGVPLEGDARRTWEAGRREYLARRFAGDARVDVEG